MILSNLEIHQALDAKRLVIDPEPQPRFQYPDQFSPYSTHSVDLRLGAKLLIPQQGPYNFDLTLPGFPEFAERNCNQIVLAADRPFILDPHRFVLGITLERVAL